jgi:hypothetical protein
MQVWWVKCDRTSLASGKVDIYLSLFTVTRRGWHGCAAISQSVNHDTLAMEKPYKGMLWSIVNAIGSQAMRITVYFNKPADHVTSTKYLPLVILCWRICWRRAAFVEAPSPGGGSAWCPTCGQCLDREASRTSILL